MSESVIFDARFRVELWVFTWKPAFAPLLLHHCLWLTVRDSDLAFGKNNALRAQKQFNAACFQVFSFEIVYNRTCVFQRSGVFARWRGDSVRMMRWWTWSRESSLSGGQRALHHRGTQCPPLQLGFLLFLSNSNFQLSIFNYQFSTAAKPRISLWIKIRNRPGRGWSTSSSPYSPHSSPVSPPRVASGELSHDDKNEPRY